MEQFELNLLIISGILSIVGLVLTSIAISSTDTSFNGPITPDTSSGKQLKITDWLFSGDAKPVMNNPVRRLPDRRLG